MNSIAVVGSGLVGVVLAISLKQKGFDVVVYDKSIDIRHMDFKGRSINLAMSDRGWKTLREIGIEDEVKQLAIPMHSRAIHTIDKQQSIQPYSVNGDSAIWAISRGNLNKELITIAERFGVEFCFDTPIWDVDLDQGLLYTAKEERDKWTSIKYDVIFGADGAYSRVRHRMQKQSMFEYQQSYLELGYKEFIIPADAAGKHKLSPNLFHIWPRKDFMFIALANTDGSFTCTLFLPYKGKVSFESIQSVEEIEVFFETFFSEVKELIPDYLALYQENPVNSLVTMKCFPWVYEGKVALIGDAAHAVVPFYGQGLNAGLEDIYVLSRIIDNCTERNWKEVFKAYQENRKPNGDAIAELSYRNFEEMSASTADTMFLLRKKIEVNFSKKYPKLWLPLYDRVTFSDDSYLKALEIGDKQKSIMDDIMQIEEIALIWDTEAIEKEILKRL
ncbi:NAD(P)-binding protein [Myroides sp. BIT-d1]|uniref:NAD(P)-binding protein n=1 Tax=Myroides albus TaxID=2562892 RepID=A0A6I3LM29_9FLAO|nr:NAD(P)/FAD-dependent oxidoreductase [Myroides albus]MTG97045.1 NAD(P)-binding protein [Myroides albus]